MNKTKHNRFSQFKILCIDDDEDILLILKSALSDINSNVLVARTGKGGYSLAKKELPHLIVLDLGLPDLNGIRVLKLLKSKEITAKIPVIVVSATSDSKEIIKALEVGAIDYLIKPFSVNELIVRVKNNLRVVLLQDSLMRENIRYSKELERAKFVQQAILPKELPRVPGIEIAAKSFPAMSVGGDFYYFKKYRATERKLGIVIGDVAGKGISAALLMSMMMNVLDSFSRKYNELEKLLKKINSIIYKHVDNHSTYYITAFVCNLDLEKGMLTYAKAGHISPIVYNREANKFIRLESKGLFLGAFKKTHLK